MFLTIIFSLGCSKKTSRPSQIETVPTVIFSFSNPFSQFSINGLSIDQEIPTLSSQILVSPNAFNQQPRFDIPKGILSVSIDGEIIQPVDTSRFGNADDYTTRFDHGDFSSIIIYSMVTSDEDTGLISLQKGFLAVKPMSNLDSVRQALCLAFGINCFPIEPDTPLVSTNLAPSDWIQGIWTRTTSIDGTSFYAYRFLNDFVSFQSSEPSSFMDFEDQLDDDFTTNSYTIKGVSNDNGLPVDYIFTKNSDSAMSLSIKSGETTSSIADYEKTASPVVITEHIHSSLPSEWITEFNTIMGKLNRLLPLFNMYYETVDIYAWNDNIDDPYPGVDGGAYIGGSNTELRFVMEIKNNEFLFNSSHRYSVIAHEFFHCYQRSLNQHMNKSDSDPTSFKTKWLIEGAAAAFESLYIQQHYNINYFLEGLNIVHSDTIQSPSIFESYDSKLKDTNYSSSTFMVLALAKELQVAGHSEAVAFKLIIKDFMSVNPNKQTWESVFETTFGMSVGAFYSILGSSKYSPSINTVLPSESLTLESIFN